MPDFPFIKSTASTQRAARVIVGLAFHVVPLEPQPGIACPAVRRATYLAAPKAEISAHYYVDETQVVQGVRDLDLAHPTGRAVSDELLHVELVGLLSEKLIANGASLLALKARQYGFSVDNVVTHGREIDPEQLVQLAQVAYEHQDRDKITLMAGEEDLTKRFGAQMVRGEVVVSVQRICEYFNWPYDWNPRTRTLHVPKTFIGEE